jgi:hypothetical protein
MSNDLREAVELIVKAGNTISKDRPGVHGSAENSFQMIGNLWTQYLRHVFSVRNEDEILPQDVARMMEMMKIARSVYGDPTNRDNYVDSIGYAALAGMLGLPSRPFQHEKKEAIDDKTVPANGGARPS